MIANNSLSQYFHNHFRVVVADTEALREEVYKIRFEVYCQELGFEPAENFPDGMERDDYDARSIHCLLQHKASNVYAGCVRFVMSDPQQPSALFPVEKVCKGQLELDALKSDRTQFVEVSRLAVKAEFRKRLQDTPEENAALSLEEAQCLYAIQDQCKMPLVALGLYMTLTSVVEALGLRFVTLMEARLSRHLKKCGLPSTKIGDFVEHSGKRAPYLMDPAEIQQNLPAESLELFHSIHNQISRSDYICRRQPQPQARELVLA